MPTTTITDGSHRCARICRALICGWMLLAATASAAEPVQVVFHVNEPAKLAMLSRSLESLRDIAPEAVINVVVNGPAVVRLSRDAEYTETVTELLANASWVGACSQALLQGRIDPAQLVPGVKVIEETGVRALIDLQGRGFAYIKI